MALTREQNSATRYILTKNIEPRSIEANLLLCRAADCDRSKRENWERISQQHGGRPVHQLIRSWLSLQLTTNKPKTQQWQPEEDLLLMELVKKYGEVTKEKAAELQVPGRTYLQSYDRWRRTLKPVVMEKTPWTPEEELRILELHTKFGPEWTKIAKRLPGRSADLVQNHYQMHLSPLVDQSKVKTERFIEQEQLESTLKSEELCSNRSSKQGFSDLSLAQCFSTYAPKTDLGSKRGLTCTLSLVSDSSLSIAESCAKFSTSRDSQLSVISTESHQTMVQKFETPLKEISLQRGLKDNVDIHKGTDKDFSADRDQGQLLSGQDQSLGENQAQNHREKSLVTITRNMQSCDQVEWLPDFLC